MTKSTSKMEAFEKEYLRKDKPSFKIGDSVEVDFVIREGDKSRVQTFTGIVISRHGTTLNETFTVRKVSFGEGVERTFPVHSPNLKKVNVIKQSKVRRAKLYYLRGKVGKKSRLKEDK